MSAMTYADNSPVWKNPSVNQQNREARRADFFAFESVEKAKGEKFLQDGRLFIRCGEQVFDIMGHKVK